MNNQTLVTSIEKDLDELESCTAPYLGCDNEVRDLFDKIRDKLDKIK